jgi:hypothetical protein
VYLRDSGEFHNTFPVVTAKDQKKNNSERLTESRNEDTKIRLINPAIKYETNVVEYGKTKRR